MEICYKIVTKDLKSLSTIFNNDFTDIGIQYKIGKWIEPKLKHSALFVFDNLRNTCEFLRTYYENYKNNKYLQFMDVYIAYMKGYMKVIPLFGSLSTLQYNIKLKKQKRRSLRGTLIPAGTIAVKKVKLIEKLCSASQLLKNLK